jgi:hypothetical protein
LPQRAVSDGLTVGMTDDEILALYREKTNNPYQHARRDASTGTTPSPSQRGDLDRRRVRARRSLSQQHVYPVTEPDCRRAFRPCERSMRLQLGALGR